MDPPRVPGLSTPYRVAVGPQVWGYKPSALSELLVAPTILIGDPAVWQCPARPSIAPTAKADVDRSCDAICTLPFERKMLSTGTSRARNFEPLDDSALALRSIKLFQLGADNPRIGQPAGFTGFTRELPTNCYSVDPSGKIEVVVTEDQVPDSFCSRPTTRSST